MVYKTIYPLFFSIDSSTIYPLGIQFGKTTHRIPTEVLHPGGEGMYHDNHHDVESKLRLCSWALKLPGELDRLDI